MLEDKRIVTGQRLAEFEDLLDKRYVRKFSLQQMLANYVDKPFLKSYLSDSYASRTWVYQFAGDELINHNQFNTGMNDLKQWVKDNYGPYVDPDNYAMRSWVEERLNNLTDEHDIATREWARGVIDSLVNREWADYATKEYADWAAQHHCEDKATKEWVLERLDEMGMDAWATREWVEGRLVSLGGGFASMDWVKSQIAESHIMATETQVRGLFAQNRI